MFIAHCIFIVVYDNTNFAFFFYIDTFPSLIVVNVYACYLELKKK